MVCNPNSGNPVSILCDSGANKACNLSKCVTAHENRHQESMKECCKSTSKSKDVGRVIKFREWQASNNAAFECNGFVADTKCCTGMPQQPAVIDYCKEASLCQKMCCTEAMANNPVTWPCPYNKDGSSVKGWTKRPISAGAISCQYRCLLEIVERKKRKTW